VKKLVCILMVCISLFTLFSFNASADSYKGYTFNYWDEAVPSQIGYQPEAVYSGLDFGKECGALFEPKDLFVTDNEDIYILDSGNNRVVVLNKNFKLKKVISEFIYNGEKFELDNPTGIFVDTKNRIYIASPNNACVLVSDANGKVIRVLEKPKTNLLEEELEFKPQRVLVDSVGTIYVTASGVYQGAILYTEEGEFDGFYGSNTVEVSASLLLDRFWKGIMTNEQADVISKYIPEEFTSFDIDERDFVFTVTQTASVSKKVKKLNPMGSDILQAEKFGEKEEIYINGQLSASRFVDIVVNKDGIISVLDQQNNRIFQYDPEGELLFISGGDGIQKGTFLSPISIECVGDKVIVLDQKKANITVMAPTAFGEKVLSAVYLYNDGKYEEASKLWEEVLQYDHNYLTAYISIGKAMMAEERFKEAAEYFKLGNDREGNSDAFQAYRNELLQKNFPIICIVIVAVIVLIIWLTNRKKKGEEKQRTKISPFRFLFHPIDSAEELKVKKNGSMLTSLIILALWFVASVFNYALTNFRFNENDIDTMNLFLLFLTSVPVFIVAVISNWGVCTLMDGKGKMKDIWIGASYCLIPYIISSFVYVACSHFVIIEESVFLMWINWIGLLWTAFALLGFLSGIHDYSFGRTLVSVFLTIIGLLVVVFIILLVVTLVQQAYSFIYSVINEIMYRIR